MLPEMRKFTPGRCRRETQQRMLKFSWFFFLPLKKNLPRMWKFAHGFFWSQCAAEEPFLGR